MLVPGLIVESTEGHQKCQLGDESSVKLDFSSNLTVIGAQGAEITQKDKKGPIGENGASL